MHSSTNLWNDILQVDHERTFELPLRVFQHIVEANRAYTYALDQPSTARTQLLEDSRYFRAETNQFYFLDMLAKLHDLKVL